MLEAFGKAHQAFLIERGKAGFVKFFLRIGLIEGIDFDIGGGGDIIGANVDIATLSSKEKFRATNLESPGAVSSGFTTSAAVLTEYVQGFKPFKYVPSPGPSTVVSQTTGPVATGGDNWWGDIPY